MLILVGELGNMEPAAGLANSWASGVYNRRWTHTTLYRNISSTSDRPEHVRCLMGYVVDLMLILQAVFLVSLEDHSEGKVSLDHVKEIIYEFYFSDKKKRIHNAIRDFRPSFAKGEVVDKIESLLKGYEASRLYYSCLNSWLIVRFRRSAIDDEDWHTIWSK